MDLPNGKRPLPQLHCTRQMMKKLKSAEAEEIKFTEQIITKDQESLPPQHEGSLPFLDNHSVRQEERRLKYPMHYALMEQMGPCSHFIVDQSIIQQHKTYKALHNWILHGNEVCGENEPKKD